MKVARVKIQRHRQRGGMREIYPRDSVTLYCNVVQSSRYCAIRTVIKLLLYIYTLKTSPKRVALDRQRNEIL